MKIIYCITVLLFIGPSFSYGKSMTREVSQEKFFQPFYKAIKSTNNTRVFVDKMKFPNAYKEAFEEYLKSSKKKMFQARKVSRNAIEVKLSNGKWARFNFSPSEGLLIGKKKFNWDGTRSVDENLNIISQILVSEYGKPKKVSSFDLLIPQAQADDNRFYDQDAVIVGGAGAVLQNGMQSSQFLDWSEDYCNSGATPTSVSVRNLLAGNYSGKNPFGDREWVRRRFFEVRNEFSSYHWKERWLHPNARYLDRAFHRFYDVQECFRKKRFINSAEMREHPVNKDPEGRVSPNSSQ